MDVKGFLFGKTGTRRETIPVYKNSVQEYIPISDIQDGVVITKDGQYVKILEILPVNFWLKSYTEQQNIIYYYQVYLKIAPDNLQASIISKKANMDSYAKRMWRFYDEEENENCRELQEDNVNMAYYLAHNEAIEKRFFLVFTLEPQMKLRGNEFRDIVARLEEEENIARQYLDSCGLEVVRCDDSDDKLINLFYEIFNKNTSKSAKLTGKTKEMLGEFACVSNAN